jgi:hypothetical protein
VMWKEHHSMAATKGSRPKQNAPQALMPRTASPSVEWWRVHFPA